MTAATVAFVVAFVALAAAAATLVLFLKARGQLRTLMAQFEEGKTAFADVVAREARAQAEELEQTLSLARSEALAALGEEERRIAEERRREVATREREAGAKLAEALAVEQRGIEQRFADWSADLTRLQEGLTVELARLGERQQQMTVEIEARLEREGERLQALAEEHRALIAKLRDDLAAAAEDVARAAVADLEQHAAEHRRSLGELTERLQRRERDLQAQIEREHADLGQRLDSQFADVERRQVEQLRRVVAREGARHAEAASQQFEVTIRASREDAARRLGRELDLAVERFAREAEGVLGERVDQVTQSAVKRIEAQLAGTGDGIGQQRASLATLERRLRELELDLRRALEDMAREGESRRVLLESKVGELQRRLEAQEVSR